MLIQEKNICLQFSTFYNYKLKEYIKSNVSQSEYLLNLKSIKKIQNIFYNSSGFSGGGPQGCNIFSIKLNLTRAFASFSQMAM